MAQASRLPGVISLALALVTTLTAGLTGVVGVARMRKAALIIEPSQELLPGRPVPAIIPCGGQPNQAAPCSIDSYTLTLDGKAVYVTLDPTSRLITETRFPAREYTLADLLIAWGTPTGLAQNGDAIHVYWDRRYAYLSACPLRLDSHVELIGYFLEPFQTSPWRWFSSDPVRDCSGSMQGRGTLPWSGP